MKKQNLDQTVKDLEWKLHLANEQIDNSARTIKWLEEKLTRKNYISQVVQKKDDNYYVLQILDVFYNPEGIKIIVT